jgi:hypothetical protein
VIRTKERARLVARSLTQEATLSFDRRDFAKTQMLLEAAYMLYASEKIQYSLARVYEAQGQKLLAMRSYQQFLRKVGCRSGCPARPKMRDRMQLRGYRKTSGTWCSRGRCPRRFASMRKCRCHAAASMPGSSRARTAW